MKKLGIMQPYLFPYIGYFQLLNAVDEYVIYDDVQYIKGGWINRNNMLVAGKKNLFTIRLADSSPNKLINEIEIKDDFTKFLKTLHMAYSKAPYRERVGNLLERICMFEDKNLAAFAGNSIREVASYLNIDTRIVNSSDLAKNNTLKGQEKVLAICKELHADTYINAIGGQELYDRHIFKQNGVTLKFLKTNFPHYEQFGGEFVPGLSIIDVMMFNSPEEIEEMLNDYELI